MDVSTYASSTTKPPPPTSLQRPNTLSVVLSFITRPRLTAVHPAVFPGDFNGSDCFTCGLPVVTNQMVVCDGCERGFHLDCNKKQAVDVKVVVDDDWMCADCVSNVVPCNRWPLGFKDEGEGTDDLPDSRKHSPGDNTFGGDRFGVPVSHLKLLHGENGSSLKEGSDVLTPCFKLNFGDRLLHLQKAPSIFGEVNLHSHPKVLREGHQKGVKMQAQSPEEIHLEALREYLLERQGKLDEGWSVELKPSRNSDEPNAIYCSPDGKTFKLMSEVACYLGLMPKRGRKRTNDHASLETGKKESRRRKSSRLSAASAVAENEEALPQRLSKENPSTSQTVGSGGKSGNGVIETGGDESYNFDDTLPVQLEDFFILSFGKIDPRPAYHSVDRIWPVGYKSYWHDKITGSVFVCEVSEGDDSGPTFIVRRCSCSELSIPSASTVLCKASQGQPDGKNEKKIVDHDEDYNVSRFLAESSPPGEHDVLSCLSSSFNECPDLRTSNNVKLESLSSCGRFGVPFGNLLWEDLIGEFSVAEYSASSAWRGVFKKFNDICNTIYKEKGELRFFCKHVTGHTSSSLSDITHEDCEDRFDPFAKFRGSINDHKFPSVVQDDKQMQICSEFLVEWLEQDRYGLDMEFVQEFLEQLPGAAFCSRYIVCNKRCSPSSSLTIGNGILQTMQNDVGLTRYGETVHTLSKGNKIPKKQIGEDLVMRSHSLPPGTPISSRLPPQYVGNAVEAHEFLCRFHEVLELQEPLSFDETEEELIHPCFGGLDLLEKTGRGNKESQDRAIHGGGSSWHTLSLDSGPVVSAEMPHAFVPTEFRGSKEAAEDKMASVVNDRSISFTLSKAHKSLLKVLISEFLSRLSAIIDPNTEGDLKPKRGRKKDTDIWTTGQLSKFDLLPINELTWPEMVRRYILAFSSVGYDLSDTSALENAKIFRCLQGDGGILCGSKSGVLGKEEDAKLLAGAIKRIYGSLDGDADILYMESTSDETSSCIDIVPNDFHVPEWVKVLEPVRKLPTNVGARIRNRINEALKLSPPEWAKIQLELSISKGVYKGNASGPTKQAVIKVLTEVSARSTLPKIDRQKPSSKQRKKIALVSEIVMMKCRSVLRRTVAGDEKNINRRKLINGAGNDDERGLKSAVTISRPLDFRIVDLRLAAGAYGNSHEAFFEDVRELWKMRRIAHGNQANLVELAGELSSNFESLYEQEVLTLFRRLLEYSKLESLTEDSKKDVEELLSSMKETPKAFWEEGVCKVCGIDKDDKSVLLCDMCDAEYHTYCLNPPLFRIPEGNWYCPSCDSGEHIARDAPAEVQLGKVAHNCSDSLVHLASILEEEEYWELSAEERILVLKFLCDELLNSSLLRQHLDQSLKTSSDDLMQEVRSLSVELKKLNSKEERLASRAGKVDKGSQDFVGDASIIKESGSVETDNNVMHSHDNAPPLDGNEPHADNLELASVRKEIELLQNRRYSIQRQLASLSLRKEFLGSDSNGRLYWGFSESGTHRIVISDANSSCCPWVYYQSDSQIYELIEYLKANDLNGRKLRRSILDWQQLGFKGSRQCEILAEKPGMASTRPEECEKFEPSTVAATFLQTKYGPFSEVEATGHLKSSRKSKASTKHKLFRCECLEPVWPSRHHCSFCHRTFFTVMEFEGHNDGKCNLITSLSVKSEKSSDMIEQKGKSTGNAQEVNMWGVEKFQNDEGCPFSFEAICSKFLIENSNTQLVREIGLIGSNGIPDFVPPGSSHNTDPALVLASLEDLKLQSDKLAADQPFVSENEKMTNDSLKCAMSEVTEAPEATNYVKPVEKPLVEKARQILKKLKMDLLDMEAALPEEGKRPYRSSSKRRWAWRAFVKSAETIYEMVQATIVLEDMIKTEYLKKMWWHWSSLVAAAKISTLSHLSLRIYSLDSAIDYEKVLVNSSSSAERNKPGRKPNSKKKEPEA